MNLEQAVVLEQNLQMLQTFISHRCDGNRNILHACVSVCFPTSNKETKEEEGERKGCVRGGWCDFGVAHRPCTHGSRGSVRSTVKLEL